MARLHVAPAAAMKLTFALNEARYRDSLNTFVRQLNADADKLLREEMRLLLRDIVNLTPPTKSPKSDQVKRSAKQRGDNAVEADLSRVATPLDWRNIENPRLAEAVYRRNQTVMLAIMKNMKQYRNASILANGDAIRSSHLQNRNRYGRVRRKVLNQVAFLTDWQRYTRTVKSRVGFARAGWLRAAEAVGLPMPNWVRRHAGYARGGFQAPTPGKLEIVATNGSVKIPNYQQNIVNAAMQARRASIESELKRLMAGGKTRRASFAGTPFSEPSR